MQSGARRGFTLIELMVTLTVIVTLLLLALPSFAALRQRSAIRGAGEHLLSFWNQARLESAKRNTYVKVALHTVSGGGYCIGAATTTDPADSTGCDCSTANACNVASFPAAQTEWNRVSLSSVTLGGSNWTPSSGAFKPAIIEPKTTALSAAAMAGTALLAGPPGNRAYRLQLSVDQFGRGVLCEPSGAVDKLSDYSLRRC